MLPTVFILIPSGNGLVDKNYGKTAYILEGFVIWVFAPK